MARPTGLEPVTYGLAYHYSFHCPPRPAEGVCGLDYIFAFSGGTRIVSTEPGAETEHTMGYALISSKDPTLGYLHHQGPDPSGLTGHRTRPLRRDQPSVSSVFPSPRRVKGLPIRCPPLWGFRFPPEAPALAVTPQARRPLLYPIELRAH